MNKGELYWENRITSLMTPESCALAISLQPKNWNESGFESSRVSKFNDSSGVDSDTRNPGSVGFMRGLRKTDITKLKCLEAGAIPVYYHSILC